MVIKSTHQRLRGKWLKILKGIPTESEVQHFNAEINAYQGQKQNFQRKAV